MEEWRDLGCYRLIFKIYGEKKGPVRLLIEVLQILLVSGRAIFSRL
jgi:hypothetical protein